jgi:hypothetical protein
MRRYKMAFRCLTVTVILLGSFTSASPTARSSVLDTCNR